VCDDRTDESEGAINYLVERKVRAHVQGVLAAQHGYQAGRGKQVPPTTRSAWDMKGATTSPALDPSYVSGRTHSHESGLRLLNGALKN
jgi:hypothetical protein